jgi:hypothetical protein
MPMPEGGSGEIARRQRVGMCAAPAVTELGWIWTLRAAAAGSSERQRAVSSERERAAGSKQHAAGLQRQ